MKAYNNISDLVYNTFFIEAKNKESNIYFIYLIITRIFNNLKNIPLNVKIKKLSVFDDIDYKHFFNIIEKHYLSFIEDFKLIYKTNKDKIKLLEIDKKFNDQIINYDKKYKKYKDKLFLLIKNKEEYNNEIIKKYENLNINFISNENNINESLTQKINNLINYYDYEVFNIFDKINYDDLYNISKINFIVIGDIHGDFMTLLNIVANYQNNNKNKLKNIILCGDVFDPFNNGVNICYNEHYGSKYINLDNTNKIIKYAAFSQIILMYVLFYLMFEKNIKIYWVLGNHDLNYGFLYFHSLIFYLYGLDQFYYNSIGFNNLEYPEFNYKIVIASQLKYQNIYSIVHEHLNYTINNKETYKRLFNCLYYLFYFQKIKIKINYIFDYEVDKNKNKIIKSDRSMKEKLILKSNKKCLISFSELKRYFLNKFYKILINVKNIILSYEIIKDKRKLNSNFKKHVDKIYEEYYKNSKNIYQILKTNENLTFEIIQIILKCCINLLDYTIINNIKNNDDILEFFYFNKKINFYQQIEKEFYDFIDEIKYYEILFNDNKINEDEKIYYLKDFKLTDLTQLFIKEENKEFKELIKRKNFILSINKYSINQIENNEIYKYEIINEEMEKRDKFIYGHEYDDKILNKIITDESIINLQPNQNYQEIKTHILNKINYNVDILKEKINICLDYTTSYFKINSNGNSYIRLIKKNIIACNYFKIKDKINQEEILNRIYNIFDSFDIYCIKENNNLFVRFEDNIIKYLYMSKIQNEYNNYDSIF